MPSWWSIGLGIAWCATAAQLVLSKRRFEESCALLQRERDTAEGRYAALATQVAALCNTRSWIRGISARDLEALLSSAPSPLPAARDHETRSSLHAASKPNTTIY